MIIPFWRGAPGFFPPSFESKYSVNQFNKLLCSHRII
jgi:hypothetical protein